MDRYKSGQGVAGRDRLVTQGNRTTSNENITIMKKVIHKLELRIGHGIFNYYVPSSWLFLSIQLQGNTPIMYYLTNQENPNADTIERIEIRIETVQTGQPIETPNYPASGQYLGSVMLAGGQFVLHFILQ